MYNIQDGDNFESISRKSYGTEINSNLIAQSNPGKNEPLIPGTTLILPDDPFLVNQSNGGSTNA